MIVVITSLTFSRTVSQAGIHAQRPPAAMAASKHTGTAITGDIPVIAEPSSADAIAPK